MFMMTMVRIVMMMKMTIMRIVMMTMVRIVMMMTMTMMRIVMMMMMLLVTLSRKIGLRRGAA